MPEFMYISDGESEWVDVGWDPPHIPFTGSPGAHYEPLDESSQPVQFFELFLTDELLQDIVVQTNLYARQCKAKVSMYFFSATCHLVHR